MVPARPAIGDLPTQHQRIGPDRDRPFQPRAGAVAFTGPQLEVGAGRGPRKARRIHGDRAGARGGRALAQSDGRRQDPRQQAWCNLMAAEPLQRGMVRHRV